MSKQTRLLEKIAISGKDVTHLKVELGYTKGGWNLGGDVDQRGLYIYVKPVKIEQREGYSTTSFMLFSGLKSFVHPMKRFSQKTLNTFKPDWELIARMKKQVMAKENLQYMPPSGGTGSHSTEEKIFSAIQEGRVS